MLTHSNKKRMIKCWMVILVMVACSGGGDGGTGFLVHNNENFSTKNVVFENEPLAVSNSRPVELTPTISTSFAGDASNVEDDIILALEQAHDQNCKCSYEITYSTPGR